MDADQMGALTLKVVLHDDIDIDFKKYSRVRTEVTSGTPGVFMVRAVTEGGVVDEYRFPLTSVLYWTWSA